MTDMAFRAGQVAPGEALLSRWWRTIDKFSLAAAILLFVVGLMLAFAASPPLAERNELDPFHYVWRQAQFGCLALGLMVALSVLRPNTIRRLAVLGFFGCFAAVVLLPWFGTDFGKGATRWYSFGFGSLQPSEFLKPCLIVTFAWLMSASFDRKGPPGLTLSFLLAAIVAGILVLQPDFGQAALILGVWSMMYFVAGAPMLLLIVLAGVGAFGGTIAYNSSEHFQRRIDGFLEREMDATSQIGQASAAIQDGGVFGVGLGVGEIKQTLPDAHTDFIIAVAAEEFGLLACLFVIALFLLITMRATGALMRVSDPFERLAGVGLTVSFALQAIINLGVAVRLLPAKGMTLPFVSYGGSSLLAVGLTLGMLFALTRKRPQDELSDVFGGGK